MNWQKWTVVVVLTLITLMYSCRTQMMGSDPKGNSSVYPQMPKSFTFVSNDKLLRAVQEKKVHIYRTLPSKDPRYTTLIYEEWEEHVFKDNELVAREKITVDLLTLQGEWSLVRPQEAKASSGTVILSRASCGDYNVVFSYDYPSGLKPTSGQLISNPN